MIHIPAGPKILPPSNATIKMLYTPEEAAQLLGVLLTWVYERTRKKAIPFRKMGKYVRFTKAELEAFIEANEAGAL